jgi:hypothetical protein
MEKNSQETKGSRVSEPYEGSSAKHSAGPDRANEQRYWRTTRRKNGIGFLVWGRGFYARELERQL